MKTLQKRVNSLNSVDIYTFFYYNNLIKMIKNYQNGGDYGKCKEETTGIYF